MGKPTIHVLYNTRFKNESIAYRKHLQIVGYAKQSYQSKYLQLQEFFSFLEKQNVQALTQITPAHINTFYSYLKQRKSNKKNGVLHIKSVHDIMRGIQHYFGYALAQGSIQINPISHLKFTNPTTEVDRKIFTQSEIKALFKATQNLQEKSILNIAYGCGLRVNEISALNKEDLRLHENLVVVVKGKYSKRRLVPINDKIKEELQHFLQEHKHTGKALFYNNKGNRIQEWTLNKLLKNILLRTDFGNQLSCEALTKIGIHTLRHSIATHFIQNGMPLAQVQTFLGHRHLESTEIYTHITQHQIENMNR